MDLGENFWKPWIVDFVGAEMLYYVVSHDDGVCEALNAHEVVNEIVYGVACRVESDGCWPNSDVDGDGHGCWFGWLR
jgi:hypothetical protein